MTLVERIGNAFFCAHRHSHRCLTTAIVSLSAISVSAKAQASPRPALQTDSAVWWHVMHHAWLPPDSEPLNNDQGAISWALSYRIDGGARYLRVVPDDYAEWRILRRDVQAALDARDSERHLADYHGITAPVWSGIATRIPEGTRSAMLVENAWIAAVLVDAAETLRRGSRADRDLSQRCLSAALVALHAFDSDMRDDAKTGGENYVFPLDVPLRAWERGRIVPLNHLAAAGYAWYRIFQMTSDPAAALHAKRIGQAAAGQMWIDRGALQWKYQTESVIEDVSHGGIVVTFLTHVEPEPLVQGIPVRKALASTLVRIFQQRGDSLTIADHVDGSRTGEARLAGTFGQWSEILPFACEEYPTVARAILQYPRRQGAQGFVGAAALLESARLCKDASSTLSRIMSERAVSVGDSEHHPR